MKKTVMLCAMSCAFSATVAETPARVSGNGGGAQTVKAALVVQNHAAGDYDGYMGGLADMLTAALSKRGFAVINPANAIGVSQNKTNQGEAMPAVSAVRLCRDLGADCLITASVRSVEQLPIGTPPLAHTLQLRITINVADGSDGSTVCGETFTVASDKPISNAQFRDADAMRYIFDNMLETAAQKCAESISAPKIKPRPVVATVTNVVNKVVVATNVVTQLAEQVTVGFTCDVPGATVVVDGAAMGTTPAVIRMPAGLHELAVTYPFCVPYEFKARFVDGQTYNVVLQLNDEGIRRWENKEKFLTTIDRIRKSGATDDYVQRAMADGRSDMLKDSHFRWDGVSQSLVIEKDGLAPLMLGPGDSVKTRIDQNNNVIIQQD